MGKHRKKENQWLLMLSFVLIMTTVVTGVVAYLIAQSTKLSNEFQPVKVTCEVQETFADHVKSDVYIQNTGDVDAYIRATVIANWVSDEGKVYAQAPKEGTDYKVEWGQEGWKLKDDGYRYYQNAVVPVKTDPDAKTDNLIVKAEAVSAPPAGFHLEIQVLATAIQANPEKVVEEAWGVTVEETIIQ